MVTTCIIMTSLQHGWNLMISYTLPKYSINISSIKVARHQGKMHCNQKGGSRKPAELTRSPTDPGSHTLSIHLKSTDTSPFLTWTIFLPSLTNLLATWRLTNPATHHPTQHTQLWSYITHRCLWGKNTQTSFMDYIHSPRA